MSRSYKKNLWITDYSKSRRFFKGQANRKIRRSKDVPDGKAYRKFYESYDICDYKFPYDPYPHVYCWGKRGLEWIEPDPVWKFRYK